LLHRALWTCSGLPGKPGNAFLYLAAGLLHADDLDLAARREWADYTVSVGDVDAGLAEGERRVFAMHLRQGDRVLLVGCGAGRDLLALRGLGFDVDGLDHSAALIGAARSHLARRGVTAQLIADPIQSATLERSYDVAIFSDGCYSLIRSARARTAALTRIGGHLSQGGRILISYHDFTPQSAMGLWVLRATARLSRSHWLPEDGDVFWRHRPGGALRYRHHFTHDALVREVEAGGFRIVSDETGDGSLKWASAVAV
jgi:SAM-dependent methyltransferase